MIQALLIGFLKKEGLNFLKNLMPYFVNEILNKYFHKIIIDWFSSYLDEKLEEKHYSETNLKKEVMKYFSSPNFYKVSTTTIDEFSMIVTFHLRGDDGKIQYEKVPVEFRNKQVLEKWKGLLSTYELENNSEIDEDFGDWSIK